MASNERVALDAGDSCPCDSTASVWPHLALYFRVLAGRGGSNQQSLSLSCSICSMYIVIYCSRCSLVNKFKQV